MKIVKLRRLLQPSVKLFSSVKEMINSRIIFTVQKWKWGLTTKKWNAIDW